MAGPIAATFHASGMMSRTIARNWRLLVAITRVELAKKYAGSVLGTSWLILQPALLLGVYLFVYLVVFKLRFPDFSRLDYVLFVFCGLVPYMGSVESIAAGSVAIKQNMHLVKNVMLPIELIPVRTVLVSMAGQGVGLATLIGLSAVNGSLTPHVLWLPLAWGFQVIGLLGLVWILASVSVALPDISYFVTLFMFLLMFVSPIAFRPEMVPASLAFMVYLNPVHYMLEVYRASLFYGRLPDAGVAVVYVALAVASFGAGSLFFRTFRGAILDYE